MPEIKLYKKLIYADDARRAILKADPKLAYCIDKLKAVDAVSSGVLDQVRWERDIALEQFADYGLSLGERADVVKVVRCKDCKHWNRETISCEMNSYLAARERPCWYEDDFCSYGERKYVK